MRRGLRFIVALVAGLAILTWTTSAVVQRTTRAWFEKDLRLRAQLAVHGARASLTASWTPEKQAGLVDILNDLTRDERVLAAAACDRGFDPLALTGRFPESFDWSALRAHWRQSRPDSTETWTAVETVGPTKVHVSAVPVLDGERVLGLVVLIHDLDFLERREASTRSFLLLAFATLALAASAITVIASRLSWRSWSEELQRLLRGAAPHRAEFQPILGDVRELIARISRETEPGADGGAWTPQRLRRTLSRHLHGEKIVILANREPYVHQRSADGEIAVVHPASGLVTALEPVMRACSGTWIAHGSGNADRETADELGRLRVPPGEGSYSLRRIWLTAEEEMGYYYGLANEGLWPLCHVAHVRPNFRAPDWKEYRDVNRRFSDAVCAEVDTEDPIVLVQDYHLALAPALIRERLPRATILTFWHIPWPSAERLGILPWCEELIEGLLGSSIIGFHTQAHCNNFFESVDRYLEARIDRERAAVVQRGRSTHVSAYPISIEWPNRWSQSAPSIEECRREVRRELGLPEDALLGVGVDRLDYTKGVEERLLAVERLLEVEPAYRGRFTFVQLAAPSRTVIESYRHLAETVEATADRINQRFGSGDHRPVQLLRAHHEPPSVFRFYRAADLCYVSSLHDGMNLVAKEFISAREDEQGVLILSQFTGAARELTEALIVNPYDLDEASAAMGAALRMHPEEQRERMRAMRSLVSEYNVYRWAGSMLMDAARLRDRDRLTHRLSARGRLVSGAHR